MSIGIASAVTSYARIHMNKIKLDLLNKGVVIYYSDTDSLVTDKPLDNDLVGTSLGLFKLEHKVKRGYFISSKTSCLITEDYKWRIKTKGSDNHELTGYDFIKLYKRYTVKTSIT